MEPEGPTFVGGGRRDEPLRVPARRWKLACHVAREDLVSERVLKRVVAGGFSALALLLVSGAAFAQPDPGSRAAGGRAHVWVRARRDDQALRRLRRLHARSSVPSSYARVTTSARRTGPIRSSCTEATSRHDCSPCAASGSYRTSSPTTSRRRTRSTTTTPRWSPTCRRSRRAYPQLVHLFSLGTSYEGRDLIAARVSNDATDNLSEPGVFFVGQHHAREHLTVEVVLSLLHLFAGSQDPKVRSSSTRARSTSSRA